MYGAELVLGNKFLPIPVHRPAETVRSQHRIHGPQFDPRISRHSPEQSLQLLFATQERLSTLILPIAGQQIESKETGVTTAEEQISELWPA